MFALWVVLVPFDLLAILKFVVLSTHLFASFHSAFVSESFLVLSARSATTMGKAFSLTSCRKRSGFCYCIQHVCFCFDFERVASRDNGGTWSLFKFELRSVSGFLKCVSLSHPYFPFNKWQGNGALLMKQLGGPVYTNCIRLAGCFKYGKYSKDYSSSSTSIRKRPQFDGLSSILANV